MRQTIVRLITDHLRVEPDDLTRVLARTQPRLHRGAVRRNVLLQWATFSGGDVSFAEATFSGGDISFAEATFSDGDVSFNLATFSDGHVSFVRATFSGGDVIFNLATLSYQTAT